MTVLESWLKQATRRLSAASVAQVRSEIGQHYECAREAAMSSGATAEEADRSAVSALGDAKAANRQYRRVLLTSGEARLLGEGNWEARLVCSRSWVKRLLLVLPLAALTASAAFLLRGEGTLAWALLAGGTAMGLLFAAPLLPVYTPRRGRVFRVVKWVALLATLVLAFEPDPLKWSWLLFSCLWPMVWVEWRRISIRRKLPVAQWPKQLYL
jgi:hypothetical protein